MFHAALWKLICLKWRGGFRQFGRSLKTVRGLIQVGFMLGFMAWSFGSMYFFGRLSGSSADVAAAITERFRDYAAFGLFALTMWAVLFSTGESTVYFTASEVAFLFTAPFHRRQLLTYKLLQSLVGLTFLSFLMSAMFARSPALWLSGFVGLVLTLTFIQLLTMNVAFLRNVLQAKSTGLIRRVIGYTALAILLTAVAQAVMTTPDGSFTALAQSFRSSTAGNFLLAPFDAFAKMMFPQNLGEFVRSAAPIVLLDVCLLAAAYRLDGLSLEAAVAISEKLTARIRQAQSKGAWSLIGSSNTGVSRRRLPLLPFWYGAGPIVWQRVTSNIRSSAKLFVLLSGAVVVAGGIAVAMHFKNPTQPLAAAGVAMGTMIYVSFLICLSLQNEIERVGYLKSLPLRPSAIVLGELLGFVVVLSVVQSLFFLALCGLLPSIAGWLVLGAVLSLPLNFLLFAIDKLVFYLFPTRLTKGAPGDFQNAGKQMLFMFMKMLALLGGLIIVAIVIIPGAVMGSPLLAVIPAVVVLLAECVGIVPLLAWAFRRFDLSVDTPA